MQRAATSTELTEEDIDAVVCRVGLANGVPINGDYPCQTFSEANVISTAPVPDDVIFHAVGPVQGLDRLAAEQTLKFAVNGVTVIFGDNGSGKSGYTRALRQLCQARVDPALHGDVFSASNEPIKSITYSYRQGTDEPVTLTWSEGDPKPPVLAGITLIDTDNMRGYVESKSDILYLPAEVDCVVRLAALYQAVEARFQGYIDDITNRCSSGYGGYYGANTTAGTLIARVQIGTSKDQLPSHDELQQAAEWNEADDAEFRNLEVELRDGPAAMALRFDRIAQVFDVVVDDFQTCLALLGAGGAANDTLLIETKYRTRRAADELAIEQIGTQPIPATGNDTWREMYRLARQFAAEAGVRKTDHPFVVGDLCPVCQQALDDDAVNRLAAFDRYVAGRVSSDADTADAAVRG
jgi:hypothetical protein